MKDKKGAIRPFLFLTSISLNTSIKLKDIYAAGYTSETRLVTISNDKGAKEISKC